MPLKCRRGTIFYSSGAVDGTEGKTALFYEDAVSGRSFRFILHRKNARKADIYACAKCKSRRKYVRIMVQNDKFLCDPASLDHICYMTPIELHNERVNNERLKQRKIKKLMAELPPLDSSIKVKRLITEFCYQWLSEVGLPALVEITPMLDWIEKMTGKYVM
uniref:FLYWCH-type domain-containing protein n=1 Tax=Angiostrongylus cantonensis TaxID=6313 RepID=A0A0K0D504_ANGCA